MHADGRLVTVTLGADTHGAAHGSELCRVVEQVREHLFQATRVTVDEGGRSDTRFEGEPLLFRFEERLTTFHGLLHDSVQIDGFSTKLDLPGIGARDVQKVVHQSHHQIQLPVQDAESAIGSGAGGPRVLQNLHGISHRGQRVSELVGEQRQKLVLEVMRVSQRLFAFA